MTFDNYLGKKMYRQGDVLLKEVESLPSNMRTKKDRIVGEGEATGHAHVITYGAVFETLNNEPKLYVKAYKYTKINHEEHESIQIESGIYEVVRQREYLGKGLEYVCCH